MFKTIHTHTHTQTDLVFADQLLSAVVHLRMLSYKKQDVFENLHVVYVDTTTRTHTHANITWLRSLSFATTTTATHRFTRTKSTSFFPLLAESFAASMVCSVRNFSESFLCQQRHTQETRNAQHARTHAHENAHRRTILVTKSQTISSMIATDSGCGAFSSPNPYIMFATFAHVFVDRTGTYAHEFVHTDIHNHISAPSLI